MIRNSLIVLGCVTLSFLLAGVSGFLYVNFTQPGQFAADPEVLNMDVQAIKAKYGGDPWALMERGLRLLKYVFWPAIAILVGLFAGCFARDRVTLIAVLGVLPLQVFFVAASSFSAFGFLLVALYTGLACAAALGIDRLKRMRNTAALREG